MKHTHFVCPQDKGKLINTDDGLQCVTCNKVYNIQEGIPIFAEKRGYWSNATKETMHQVIRKSIETKDWRAVLKAEIPLYERHISPLFRGDIHSLLGFSSDSVVLDAGSMWGGLTIPFSQRCKTIFALDQTWESLRYLGVRAELDGIKNIVPVESSIANLPFEDSKFDLIILNGVLEWLATEDEVILERDWQSGSAKANKTVSNAENPEEIQLQGLKELNRTLSSDGSIYIAIENRIGLQYFAGYPDDHVNIRFVSFMPRFIADIVTRLIKKHSYRTYIYSPNHLKRLLHKAGFNHVDLFSQYPYYNIISRMVGFDDFDTLQALPTGGGTVPLNRSGKIKIALFSIAWRLIPNPFRKHMTPSIGVIASKIKNPVPWIVSELHKQFILEHKEYSVILFNNRFGDEVPANLLLRNKVNSQIEYFCKIGRLKGTKNIIDENNTLSNLNQLIHPSHTLHGSIPQLVSAKTIDGFEMQVTKYEKLKASEALVESGVMKTIPDQFNGLGFKAIVKSLARARWARKTNSASEDALQWLGEFNRASSKLYYKSASDLIGHFSELDEYFSPSQIRIVETVFNEIKKIDIGAVPVGIEHGDFDFCNIFRKPDGSIFIVDFEHAAENSVPFFDIGNLLFSTLAREWKNSDKKETLSVYAKRNGYEKSIIRGLNSYAKQSKVSKDILSFTPALAMIRLFTKPLPKTRNRTDYPLYDDEVFNEMLNWKLVL
ncbi:methyltransferase domain-containing protein [Amylibacter sp.]|nr:methyltransferase domain-containing protein [Amylibacter sp.]